MSLQSLILDTPKPWLNARVNDLNVDGVLTVDGQVLENKKIAVGGNVTGTGQGGGGGGTGTWTGTLTENNNSYTLYVNSFTIPNSTFSTLFSLSITTGSIPLPTTDVVSNFVMVQLAPSNYVPSFATSTSQGGIVVFVGTAVNVSALFHGWSVSWVL